MKHIRYWIWLMGMVIVLTIFFPSTTRAQNKEQPPILILTIDKLDTTKFFETKLPGIKALRSESSLGLLNVRSASGYETVGGYLTLGSGDRVLNTDKVKKESGAFDKLKIGEVYRADELILGEKASNWWNWSQNNWRELNDENLIIPKIELIKNQARNSNITVAPGLLGEIFHKNQWQTSLISGFGSKALPRRVSGLLLMDQQGMIDFGFTNQVYEADPNFIDGLRFSSLQVSKILEQQIQNHRIIQVDFDDFARLDQMREWFLPKRYTQLKEDAWLRLDHFLTWILGRWSREELNLVLLSPSPSKEAIMQKNLLLPIVIRGANYQAGLLTSGSTKWDGLVANLDLLPSLAEMAALKNIPDFTGRKISAVNRENSSAYIKDLNQQINQANNNQRTLLDLLLGIIATGWILALLLYFLKRKELAGEVLLIVLISPVALLIMPFLPASTWGVLTFIGLTLLVWAGLRLMPQFSKRLMVISLCLWLLLVIDQLMGWQLIRYSALGYSAVAGSRYYGMGNEYMGIFLALTLILAYYTEKINQRIFSLIILGLGVAVLGLPWLGINFGGTLAALVGFGFYLLCLHKLKLNNWKFWVVPSIIGVLIFLLGWGDSLRQPELQTHLGRFFAKLFSGELQSVWQVIERKMEMNFKLMIYSPWMRINLLALVLGIVLKVFMKQSFPASNEKILWQALLVAGIAALLLNDSGVVALATCLSYGFTFVFSKLEARVVLNSDN